MSVRSSCSSLINYWERRMEIPAIIVDFSISSFQVYQILLHLSWNCFTGYMNWHQCHHEMTFFIPGNILCSDISFVWCYYRYSNFLLIIIIIINLFLSLHIKMLCFVFLQAVYSWVLLFYPIISAFDWHIFTTYI